MDENENVTDSPSEYVYPAEIPDSPVYMDSQVEWPDSSPVSPDIVPPAVEPIAPVAEVSQPLVVRASQLRPTAGNSADVAALRNELYSRNLMPTTDEFNAQNPGNEYDENVKNAVRQWQEKNFLRVTGILNYSQAKLLFAGTNVKVFR